MKQEPWGTEGMERNVTLCQDAVGNGSVFITIFKMNILERKQQKIQERWDN